MNLHALSLAELPKSVLTLIWVPITARCTSGGALCGSMDGPRSRTGQSGIYGRSGVFSTASQTVCAQWPDDPHAHRGCGVRQWHLDLTSLEGPHQGGEIVGFVLGSTCHPRRL
jgi:hypothetical protein